MKYWNRAWNPVAGCTACSEGCQNCIARRLIERRQKAEPALSFRPHVNVKQLMKHFDDTPELIRVAAGGDLFHPSIPTDIIDRVLRTCRGSVNQRFLILTKRSERLSDYLNDPGLMDRLSIRHADGFFDHIAFGVSVESSRYLYRLRHLQSCWRITHKFVAFEPLLEGYDYCAHLKDIEWVTIGAESSDDGSHRPCQLEWIEDIVRGCGERGIPVCVNSINLEGQVTDDFDRFPEILRRDQRMFDEDLIALSMHRSA